jgi:ATP-binding cassette subfamily F protein uup
MVAQRGYGVAALSRGSGEGVGKIPAPVVKAEQAQKKRRLSFKEKHALETLPGKIAEGEAEIEKLRKQLDDADLYTRDPARFEALTQSIAKAQLALNGAEEQWLSLEMLREELEG